MSDKNKNFGQIIVGLIIGVFLLTSALILFQYVTTSSQKVKRFDNYIQAELFANLVLQAVKAEIIRQDCGSNCQHYLPIQSSDGSGTNIYDFKNFNIQNPKPYVFSNSNITQALQSPYDPQEICSNSDCFVRKILNVDGFNAINASNSTLETLNVEIQSNSVPDLEAGKRAIEVKVVVTTKQTKETSSAKITLKKNFIIRALTWNYYTLWLYDGLFSPKINIVNSNSKRNTINTSSFEGVYIYGPIYDWTNLNSTTTIPLSSIVDLPQLNPPFNLASKVIFNGPVFFPTKFITGSVSLNQKNLEYTFTKGIYPFSFNSEYDLSFNTPNSGCPSFQPYDYKGKFPLPYSYWLSGTNVARDDGDTNIPPQYHYANDSTKALGFDDQTLPNSNLGFQKISDTCNINYPTVYIKTNSDLTLDFSLNPDSNYIFCGQVLAKQIKIIMPNKNNETNYNVVLLGNFKTYQIEVDFQNKSGPPYYQLHIINPMHQSSLPQGVNLPNGMTPAIFYGQLLAFNSSYTQCFVQPFLKVGAPTPPFQYGQNSAFKKCDGTEGAVIGQGSDCLPGKTCYCKSANLTNYQYFSDSYYQNNWNYFKYILEEI